MGSAEPRESVSRQSPVVWDRPEPRPRSTAQLSRRVITDAAVAIADADGLDAMTMRSLAAALSVSPMSLYRFVEGKRELVDLMIDAAFAEIDLSGIPSGHWRQDLERLAHQQRASAHRHPWSAAANARPSVGPAALRHFDTSLAVFDDIDLPMEWKAWATNTIETYVRGFVELELADRYAERTTGTDADQWRAALAPYINRVLADGTHPRAARFFQHARPIDPDAAFSRGLGCLLDGIAADLIPTEDS